MTPEQQAAIDAAKSRLAPAATPQRASSWGDTIGRAVSNIPSSAGQFVSDMAQPFLHPIETAQSLGNLALGAGEKLIPGEQGHEQYADAVGGYLSERYGGFDKLRETFANDPIGLVSDFAAVLTGGGGLAAKAPGIIGKAGRVAGKVGSALDPIEQSIKLGSKAVGGTYNQVAGSLTGAGAQSFSEAAKAGRQGGARATAFTSNMRTPVAHTEELVQEAKTALSVIRDARHKAYVDNMAKLGQSPKVLDFNPIRTATDRAKEIGEFKGQRIDPGVGKIWEKLDDEITKWQGLDPAEYHTALGLDALKKSIGSLRDEAPFGTPARVAADRVYNAIKTQIMKADPQYAKYMSEYEKASNLLTDLEKTLSLNRGASVDTTIRKLQSVMRNNVNTNFSRRGELATKLVDAGADNLMPGLAGQSLGSFTPRGIQGAAVGAGGLLTAVGNPSSLKYLPALALTSPRLMGEATYFANKVGSKIPAAGLAKASNAAGRETRNRSELMKKMALERAIRRLQAGDGQ